LRFVTRAETAARARFARFRKDTTGTVELGLTLFKAGDDASGEIIRPLLVIGNEVEKALDAGEWACANELLDVARDSPRNVFSGWREHDRANRERSEAYAALLEQLVPRLPNGPKRDRAVEDAAALRRDSALLYTYSRRGRLENRTDPKLALVDIRACRSPRRTSPRVIPRERRARRCGRNRRSAPRPSADDDVDAPGAPGEPST
jgi:hypothetical protein